MQDDADHTENTILVFVKASELDAKCQETLLELVPSARQIGVLADSPTTAPSQLGALEEASSSWRQELKKLTQLSLPPKPRALPHSLAGERQAALAILGSLDYGTLESEGVRKTIIG
jgi:hypothetical protein